MALTAMDLREAPDGPPPALAPTRGQLARARGRMWVVADVARDSQAAVEKRPVQHLVSLVSIEDDALGEELQVIWEIEPGARGRDQSTLPSPTGFDPPRRLDAFLDAVRWGAVSSADGSDGSVPVSRPESLSSAIVAPSSGSSCAAKAASCSRP